MSKCKDCLCGGVNHIGNVVYTLREAFVKLPDGTMRDIKYKDGDCGCRSVEFIQLHEEECIKNDFSKFKPFIEDQ